MIPSEPAAAGPFYDHPTGLLSSALFEDRLAHALLRMARTDDELALMAFEVRNPGGANERIGSGSEDALLRSLAHRMRGALRKVDTLARLHDEGFAVIAENLKGPGNALLVARKLEDALSQPFRIDEASIEVEIRGGIAVFPFDGATAEALWAAATRALESARSSTAAGFAMADPGLADS